VCGIQLRIWLGRRPICRGISLATWRRLGGEAGPIFEDGLFTRAAALAGFGIALTRSLLIQDELKEGTLVQLSSKGFDDGQHYFICLRSDKDLPKGARHLHNWLRKQALK